MRPIAATTIQPTAASAPWYEPAVLAHFPATKPPRPIPIMVKAPPAMGARSVLPTTVTITATAAPARTAGQRIGGAERRSMGKESNRLKRKPIREAYADRWVRERCQDRK